MALTSSSRGVVALIALAFLPAAPLAAAVFTPVTVADLVAAIQTANVNGVADVIDLGAGTFSLSVVEALADGQNGLPSVTESFSLLITNGTIERNAVAPAFRLLHVAATGDLELSDLVLRGGLARAEGSGEPLGGAVFNRGQLQATGVTFEGNAADPANGLLAGVEALGGAIFNATTGTITSLVDCTFSDNAARAGGSIAVLGGLAAGRGGAIFSELGGAIVSLVDCAFLANSAESHGGTLMMGPEAGQGGAIFLDGGIITNIVDNHFDENQAESGASAFFPTALGQGGAMFLGSGSTMESLANSTFSGNSAGDGGAIFSVGSTITVLSNSTFSANAASNDGGALHIDSGSTIVSLTNVTMTHNDAEVAGGGVHSSGAIESLVSAIVAANTAGSLAPDIFLDPDSGSIVTAAFNLVGTDEGHSILDGVNDNQVGTLLAPLDPLVGPLAANGGPTPTRALLAGSPAIDAGANPLGLAFDQRGTPFDRTSGGQTDVGAFEHQAEADLVVTKVDSPDPIVAGTQLAYTITVDNAGPDAAADVTLDDTLPAGTTFVSLSPPGGWSCSTPGVGSGGTVSCSLASLGVGSAVFTLTVAVDPSLADGTELTNTATAASTTNDTSPDNEVGTATTTVTTAADLAVTKVDTPDPVLAGSNLTYTLTVGNAGPSAAAAVTLDDTLPAETTFVSLSSPGGWNCSTPGVGSGGTVSCSIASLGAGSAVFTLAVAVEASVADGTVLSNTATAASTTADSNPGDESATATSTVQNGAATLSGTKTVSGSFVAGGEVTYTVVLTNAGPGTQADNPGVEFTDVLPPELALLSASATAGTAAADPGTNTVAWNGSLAAGASVELTITATILPGVEGQTIANQGSIAYDGDGDGINESSAPTDDPAAPGQADVTLFSVAGLSVVEIPTLSPAVLMLLSALLAAAGVVCARR